MKIYYRISDQSYTKVKLPGATKEFCFRNFISCFPNADLTIIADNCSEETCQMLKNITQAEVLKTSLSNAGSFRFALDLALQLPPLTPVYFVEDDYLHFRGNTEFGNFQPAQIIQEGLTQAQYVTLFDHPDKYESEFQYGEVKRCFRTSSIHWRETIATCMTFATTVWQLQQDVDIWKKHTEGHHPHDFYIFLDLNRIGRKLAVCLPGLAYHTDLTYPIYKSKEDVVNWVVDLLVEDLASKSSMSITTDYEGRRKLMLFDAYARLAPKK